MRGDDVRGACAAVNWPRTTLPREPSVRLHLPRWGACAFRSGPPRPQSRDPPGRLQGKRSSGRRGRHVRARAHDAPLLPRGRRRRHDRWVSASGSGASPDEAPPFPPRPSPPRPFTAAAAGLVASPVASAALAGGGGWPGSFRFGLRQSPPASRRAGAELALPSVCARWLNRDRTVQGPRGPKCSGGVTDLFYPRGRRGKMSGQALWLRSFLNCFLFLLIVNVSRQGLCDLRTFFGLASIYRCNCFGVVPGGGLEKKRFSARHGVGSVTLWSLSCLLYPFSAGGKQDSVVSAVGFLLFLERLIHTWGIQNYWICLVIFLLHISSCFDFWKLFEVKIYKI